MAFPAAQETRRITCGLQRSPPGNYYCCYLSEVNAHSVRGLFLWCLRADQASEQNRLY